MKQTPSIICKSGYIKSRLHMERWLNYSGNKLHRQVLLFPDGSRKEAAADKKLTARALSGALAVELFFKDGGSCVLPAEKYREQVKRLSVETVLEAASLIQDDTGSRSLGELELFSYTKYVGNRPGVERSEQGHGYFGVTGDLSYTQVMQDLQKYHRSIKWVHILSLPEELDKATGFDQREAWRNLIVSRAPDFAKLYNISLENLVINCAFHSNSDNSHVHLCLYSRDPTEGFLRGGRAALTQASKKLKSMVANDIFGEEFLQLRVEHDQVRTALKNEIQQYLSQALSRAEQGDSHLFTLLYELAGKTAELSGRQSYGYLPPAQKRMTDNILRYILTLEGFAPLYQKLEEIQRQNILHYQSDPVKAAQRMEQFRREFFHPKKGQLRLYHNCILKAAESLHSPAEGETEQLLPAGEALAAKAGMAEVQVSEIRRKIPPELWQELAQLQNRASSIYKTAAGNSRKKDFVSPFQSVEFCSKMEEKRHILLTMLQHCASYGIEPKLATQACQILCCQFERHQNALRRTSAVYLLLADLAALLARQTVQAASALPKHHPDKPRKKKAFSKKVPFASQSGFSMEI